MLRRVLEDLLPLSLPNGTHFGETTGAYMDVLEDVIQIKADATPLQAVNCLLELL